MASASTPMVEEVSELCNPETGARRRRSAEPRVHHVRGPFSNFESPLKSSHPNLLAVVRPLTPYDILHSKIYPVDPMATQYRRSPLLAAYAFPIAAVSDKADAPRGPTGVDLYARFALGGAVCCSVTHGALTPVDVVKTRIQLEPEVYNRGMVAAFRQISAKEGAGALLTGFGPTALGYAFQGAFKFGGYEFWKKTAVDTMGIDKARQNREIIYLGASAIAEFFADVVLCPLEATRIRLVSQPDFAGGLASGFSRIAREEGLRGFYSGFGPILFKQVPYTMAKFAVFEIALENFVNMLGKPKSELSPGTLSSLNLGSGLVAGFAAAIISQPADTLLSKINKTKALPGETITSRLVKMAGQLGVKGLFTGMGARLVMVGTLTAGQSTRRKIRKSPEGPLVPYSEEAHTPQPPEWLLFSGAEDEDVSLFLQEVQRIAFGQGRQDDDVWMVRYAAACLQDYALAWYNGLDVRTQSDWYEFRAAIIRRFAAPGTVEKPMTLVIRAHRTRKPGSPSTTALSPSQPSTPRRSPRPSSSSSGTSPNTRSSTTRSPATRSPISTPSPSRLRYKPPPGPPFVKSFAYDSLRKAIIYALDAKTSALCGYLYKVDNGESYSVGLLPDTRTLQVEVPQDPEGFFRVVDTIERVKDSPYPYIGVVALRPLETDRTIYMFSPCDYAQETQLGGVKNFLAACAGPEIFRNHHACCKVWSLGMSVSEGKDEVELTWTDIDGRSFPLVSILASTGRLFHIPEKEWPYKASVQDQLFPDMSLTRVKLVMCDLNSIPNVTPSK
ncbi:Cu/Pi carrier [Tulasnella sp. 403]|nr:Cu/Pi carrier [Tulasnella sp. 403]